MRIAGLATTAVIALACGLAVYRYPSDLAIGSAGLGSLMFWLVASAPLAFYVATFLRNSSSLALTITTAAVALSFIWVAAAWAGGGEGTIVGVGLAPFAFWLICAVNYILIFVLRP